ncbi:MULTISPECIES: porin [unclassified Variovorax]|uniref:porin n=1 Tax=unclassified Variovorax TaxID=663243 RepID=UPI001BD3966F|nr:MULTISPECIES: porin [unclassified Variovorax]
MKKTSVSLALLALAGAASAQSSLTVFGIVDAGVSYYSMKSDNVGVINAARPASVTLSQTALTSGNYVPSRWGFRGTEDLGGGLAASFWLEQSLNVDDGTQPLSSRRSTVSLSGGFGEIRLGRDVSPTFVADTVTDPFLNTGVGANLIGMVNARLAVFTALPGGGLLAGPTGGPANYIFVNNTIGYFTPNTLGGFFAQAMGSFHENVKSSSQFDSPSKRGQFFGMRVGYANGGLDVSASYGVSTAIDALPPAATPLTDTQVKTANLAATYDFGFMKLAGELSRATNDSKFTLPGAAASTSADYDGAMVGVTVPVGPVRIKSSYGYVKYKPDNAAVPSLVNPDAAISKFSLGLTYNFSRRTLLYATTAFTSIHNGKNNPTVMGVPPQPSGAFAAFAGYAPRSARGYEAGMSHSF